VFTRRPPAVDEKRIIDFIEAQTTLSETSLSLANKLGIDSRVARRILEHMVEEGGLHRRAFDDIEPVYYRNPRKAS
jgi:ribosomal protein S25